MASPADDRSPADVAWRLGLCAAVAVAILLCPRPDAVTVAGWHALAVFAATILGLLLRPLAMGPTVLLALVTLGVGEAIRYKALDTPKAEQVLVFKKLVSGYGEGVVWLVVAAFLVASAVIDTGLGRRIALLLIRALGRTMLGLGWALCMAELALGPFIPSNTARGGGLMAPIVNALAHALDSRPDHEPDRAGRFLVLVGAHANLITAAMFLTGMAANHYVSEFAASPTGLNVEFGWGMWALGALVPGLVGLAGLPLLLRWLAPPAAIDTSAARDAARQQLADMGRWTRDQKILCVVLLTMLGCWATYALHGVGTTAVAWSGVMALVLVRTVRWKQIIGNTAAWDALAWLGGLVALAKLLQEQQVATWFADSVRVGLGDAGLSGITVTVVLGLIYFYSMYGFSMLTGHILALAAAFFAAAHALGAPPLVTVAVVAYFSNLCACTTTYSTGPVVIYFGLGYVPSGRWFATGFVVSLYHLAVWLPLGLMWWKVLGWW